MSKKRGLTREERDRRDRQKKRYNETYYSRIKARLAKGMCIASLTCPHRLVPADGKYCEEHSRFKNPRLWNDLVGLIKPLYPGNRFCFEHKTVYKYKPR